jgi:murein DD-endopeptidase MepM/ murein hydrolase activator NlpD
MNGIPYIVKPGDTLTKISKNWDIPLEILADVNNIQRDALIAGQNIFLPGARMPSKDLKLAMGTLFIHPLKVAGVRMTSGFGWRKDPFTGEQRLHEALDLAIALGTPVRAASEGRVAYVGTDPGYGRYIILSHSDNIETLYAHLSVVSVKQGDRVEQGAKIGEVGNTGRSTGPHLHFALYKSGRAVNPLEYISP